MSQDNKSQLHPKDRMPLILAVSQLLGILQFPDKNWPISDKLNGRSDKWKKS
jgi:hypothetical protein